MNKILFYFCLASLSVKLIAILIEIGAINNFLKTKKTENNFFEKQIIANNFATLLVKSALLSCDIYIFQIISTIVSFLLLILFKKIKFYDEVISQLKNPNPEEVRRKPKSFFKSKDRVLFAFSFFYLWILFGNFFIALVVSYIYLKIVVWSFETIGVCIAILPFVATLFRNGKAAQSVVFGLDKLQDQENIIDREIFSHLRELGVEYEFYKIKTDSIYNSCVFYLGKKASIILIGDIEKILTRKELTAILYHEIGHIVQNSCINGLIISSINACILIALKLLFLNQCKKSSLMNFTKFELFFIYDCIFNVIVMEWFVVLKNIIQQNDEIRADDYSKSQCDPYYSASALIKIGFNRVKKIIFTSGFNYLISTHPTVFDRLKRFGYD
ncbi:CAAX prenyl protease 1 like protein [Nosema granulosis]|uniref:CAAX prenyl protease 1 like protein n=1 Tax=Nosema granulosis TaxID=83296 RepID=A0A9P6KXQ2_9MICR|nr:CAAX prenyl protease 1 like protein [Nosema granulosis]